MRIRKDATIILRPFHIVGVVILPVPHMFKSFTWCVCLELGSDVVREIRMAGTLLLHACR